LRKTADPRNSQPFLLDDGSGAERMAENVRSSNMQSSLMKGSTLRVLRALALYAGLTAAAFIQADQAAAQTTIAKQDFEATPGTPVWAITGGGSFISTATGSGDVPANQRIRAGSRSWQVNANSATLELGSVSTVGYTGVKATVRISCTSSNGSQGADQSDRVRVWLALNGGVFPSAADITVTGSGSSRWSYNNTINDQTAAGTPITAAASNGTNTGTIHSTLVITVPNGTTSVNLKLDAINDQGNEIWSVDDVTLTGTATPTLSASALAGFGTRCVGSPSTNSFTITGYALTTANIAVAALSGYTYSTTSNGTYTNTLSLTHAAGSYSQQVFVKFNPTATASYNGNIGISGGGATAISVAATGSGQTPTTWYADADNDGAGDPALILSACTQPSGYVTNNTDGCPADANKTAPGVCGCGVAEGDDDGDGIANCNDGCPNDASKAAPGQCGCGNPDTDTDLDGTADCIDGCPDDPEKVAPGVCGCSTPDDDTDADGLKDCVDPCPNSANNADSDGDGTPNCTDNCPNDPNKVNPGACGCGTADGDSDNDGYMNCNDACPNDPYKIAPGTCGCGVADVDSDGDGVFNCVDNCPNLAGQIGSPCSDGNANTVNDAIDPNCQCVGTTATNSTPTIPTTTLQLQLTTDSYGASTSWQLIPLAGGAPVWSGSGYGNGQTITVSQAVPVGSYRLRFADADGDGMCCTNGNGGYVLRDANGERIIDAVGAGIFGATAEVTLGFSTTLGTDRLTSTRCDRENYLPSEFIQAVPNASVQMQYGIGDPTDDGYQFWFFNPNGGYSRRILITHANANAVFPPGADRCSYLKFSSVVTSPIPTDVLLNVRVRTMMNGVYSEFGPACRLKIDLTSQCPTTQLLDAPNDPRHSCGRTGCTLNGSTTLHCVPVSAANRYQWEFTKPGQTRRTTTTGSSLVLAQWATNPLVNNSRYDVRVRASYDNGTTYCPFGAACEIIIGTVTNGTHHSMIAVTSSTSSAETFNVWPNPSTGNEGVHLMIQGFDEASTTVQIVITDVFGKTVRDDRMIFEGDMLDTMVSTDGIAPGGYVLNVITPYRTYTRKLVVN
jgi:hypothetical protein